LEKENELMAGKTWLITGTSKGFGRLWSLAALERGDRVAALARDRETLRDLHERYRDRALTLSADVTDRHAVQKAVTQAYEHFGRLDVVVSNAGVGLFGAIEETSEVEARHLMETNFFGSLWVIQAATPLLRAQGGGHLVQVSSFLGVATLPYLGLYNASKWAVEGLIQSVAAEVQQFGIKTTLIEPGPFGTDWFTSSPHAEELPAYDESRREFFNHTPKLVNPVNTHIGLFAAVDADEPPTRLFLSSFPHPIVSADYQARLAQWDAWKDIAATADAD
jgi:NAD(P)-dependent dehydrogenase (short-subunit alcohol dehydrogenase family)